MKKLILLACTVIFTLYLNAQTIDHIAISSGGANTNELSYVIGETFGITLTNGDINMDFGSQGGTDLTGKTNTSIKSFEDLNSFECYPNPATDVINLKIKMEYTGKIQAKIYDLTSRLLMMENIQYSEFMQLNINTLSDGSYLLILTNKDAEFVGISKFVKSIK